MIGNVTYGKTFGGLSSYLMDEKAEDLNKGLSEYLLGDSDRVGGVYTRNTFSMNLQDIITEMRCTSRTDMSKGQLHKPVMHLSVSFHEDDAVNPLKMKEIMNKTLNRLGLGEHQALMVVHKDKNHPHIHAMINRVHPDTGAVWARDFDYRRIQKVMRDLEKEYAMKRVKSSHEIDRRNPTLAEKSRLAREERDIDKYGFKTWDTSQTIIEKGRKLHLTLICATSFREFDRILARQGLYIERKGSGSVITDGIHQVKSSRVSRDFGIRKLERKFGEDFGAYIKKRDSVTQDLSPILDKTVLEDFMKQSKQERFLVELVGKRDELELQLDRLRSYKKRHAELGGNIMQSLSSIYMDKNIALRNIRKEIEKNGLDSAMKKLASSPGRFGDSQPGLSEADIRVLTSRLKWDWVEMKGLHERSPKFSTLSNEQFRNFESKLSGELHNANDRIRQFNKENPDLSFRRAKQHIVNTLQRAMKETNFDEVQAKLHLDRAGIEVASVGKSVAQLSMNPGKAGIDIVKKIAKRVLTQALEQAKSRGMGY